MKCYHCLMLFLGTGNSISLSWKLFLFEGNCEKFSEFSVSLPQSLSPGYS